MIIHISSTAEPSLVQKNPDTENFNKVDTMMQNNIQPATEKDLQSKPEENKLPEKSSNEQILEDLIKTQIELFMKIKKMKI